MRMKYPISREYVYKNTTDLVAHMRHCQSASRLTLHASFTSMVGTPSGMVVVPLAAAVDVTRLSNKTEKMAVMVECNDRFFLWIIEIFNISDIISGIMPNWCYNSLTVTTTGTNDGEKIWFGKMTVSPTSPT